MSLILKKATRKQVKLRLNLSGPSGSGKTFSALKMAYGLVGDWEKIAVIDTENGSASLYSHLGEFSVIDLHPPFAPERYIEALELCESSGIECAIMDSSSHEWTTLVDQNQIVADTSFRGNSWAAWSKTTPRHDKFVNAVLHSNMHIITCTRSKTETIQEGGKVKKIGMKDIQRENWEYELTVSLNIDRDTHLAVPSKDRTNLFEGKQPFLISEKTGQLIKDWCESGVSELQMGINEMEIVVTMEDLKTIWSKYKSLQLNKEFVSMKDKRKSEIEAIKDIPVESEELNIFAKKNAENEKKLAENALTPLGIAVDEISKAKDSQTLKALWIKHKSFQKEPDFLNAKEKRKSELSL